MNTAQEIVSQEKFSLFPAQFTDADGDSVAFETKPKYIESWPFEVRNLKIQLVP